MKKIIIGLSIIVVLISGFIIFNYSSGQRLVLSEEEINYIENNKDTIFMVGYFPTPAERRFCEKLCQQIERDTSLKLRVYDDSWHHTLSLLEKGSLPIVTNMNMTKKREDFTLFTDSLVPIDCGIYSGNYQTIGSFNDINGKIIGVEKDTALSESFPAEYPLLDYTLKVYNTFEETRQAFERGEIDGFLSTKSYDEKVKNLHFFKVDSITLDTNHVGVSKQYPILYSILSKEVSFLIDQKWDTDVSRVINYEFEKSLIDFTDAEKKYLKENEVIRVGLPTEYFLYAYGEDYNPQGTIPEILKKIEFISDIYCSYEYDELEDLRLREDIDLYVDYETSKNFFSPSIFSEEILIVGSADKNMINEIYELSMYNVGVFGVPNAYDFLKVNMPNIDLLEYKDIELAAKAIRKGRIDYLVVPHLFFETTLKDQSLHGYFNVNINRFVSDDEQLMQIISKCLFIIDTDTIVEETMEKAIPSVLTDQVIIISLLAMALIAGGYKVLRMIRALYYIDNEYNLYNVHYLERHIKKKNPYFMVIELDEIDVIELHYGSKILKKYLTKFIREIKSKLQKKEYLIFLEKNKFLLVLYGDIDKYIAFMNKLEVLSEKRKLLNYKKSICYCLYDDTLGVGDTLSKMAIGLKIAKESNEVLNLTDEKYQQYKDRVAMEIQLKESIIKNEITLHYHDIVGQDKEVIGQYVSTKVKGVMNVYKRAEKMGLAAKLDKNVLSNILKASNHHQVFVKVSTRPLCQIIFLNG